MYDPDLYDAHSEMQRRDARELVPYMVSRMNWRKATRILDFGCGSGFITKNILLPLLETTKSDPHLYAIDLSKKMIDFAAMKYTASNVTYLVADIMKDNCEFPCKFDKIFSSHVLHWILDQEKALKQLFNLLHCQGELGIYFIAKAPVFSVYKAMSENSIWAPYLTDVNNFIPKTQYSEDPSKDIGSLMTQIGFHVQESMDITRRFTFTSLDTMINSALAANPFFHRIPLSLQEPYKADFRHCFLPFVRDVVIPESQCAVDVEYQLVLIRACKF